ncbi:MAG: glutaredoxin/malate transporter fusion protein [Acidimicrobiales bacterium]|nr:glutaredoxin/malate transporter fusion protein [Acidimicrobiales bacterium]
MRRVLTFPNPVDEVSARLVAAGVVVLTVTTIVTGQAWLTAVLAYGFAARVLAGPTLSPLGQLATRVVRPRLRIAARPVPGPPKRFAQAIGATLSISAAVLHLAFGRTTLALVLVGAIALAATLESVFGYCIGCKLFGLLMRLGLIPADVCEACGDLALRRRPVDAEAATPHPADSR